MLIAAGEKFGEVSGSSREGGPCPVPVGADTADLLFERDLGGWGVTGEGATIVAAGV